MNTAEQDLSDTGFCMRFGIGHCFLPSSYIFPPFRAVTMKAGPVEGGSGLGWIGPHGGKSGRWAYASQISMNSLGHRAGSRMDPLTDKDPLAQALGKSPVLSQTWREGTVWTCAQKPCHMMGNLSENETNLAIAVCCREKLVTLVELWVKLCFWGPPPLKTRVALKFCLVAIKRVLTNQNTFSWQKINILLSSYTIKSTWSPPPQPQSPPRGITVICQMHSLCIYLHVIQKCTVVCVWPK